MSFSLLWIWRYFWQLKNISQKSGRVTFPSKLIIPNLWVPNWVVGKSISGPIYMDSFEQWWETAYTSKAIDRMMVSNDELPKRGLPWSLKMEFQWNGKLFGCKYLLEVKEFPFSFRLRSVHVIPISSFWEKELTVLWCLPLTVWPVTKWPSKRWLHLSIKPFVNELWGRSKSWPDSSMRTSSISLTFCVRIAWKNWR